MSTLPVLPDAAMFRHVIFVSPEELNLSDDALKSIKALNACIPAKCAAIWLTMEEMADRLVHCGVLHFLKPDHLYAAHKKFANVGPLEKRRQGSGGGRRAYFRPPEFTDGAPLDHRGSDGGPIPRYLPPKKYFEKKGAADSKMMLGVLNKELRRVEEIERGIKEGRIQLIPDTTIAEVQTEIGGAKNVPLGGSFDKPLTFVADTETTREAEGNAGERSPGIPPGVERADERMRSSVPHRTSSDGDSDSFGWGEEYSDGFGLFQINDLVDFITALTSHAARCGGLVELVGINFREGAGITMKFRCTGCGMDEFVHRNCNWITTPKPEDGRKFSRPQPELNIKIVKTAREVGINLTKMVDFLSFIGVKVSAYQNILHQERKVRGGIEDLSEERLKENLREHVRTARQLPDYAGDVVWTDENGETHRTARGPGAMDGGGCTRAYAHKIKGTQAALIVYSLLTMKPIMLIHKKVKCILCTRAYNKANRGRTQKLYLDDVQVMEHDGKCWKNASQGAAGQEERCASEAARKLLFDDEGKYRGDDEAVFLHEVCSDNDTRSPSNFIKEQNRLIGPTSDGLAEHVPDIGHVLKNYSNALYDIRKKDPSFSGKDLLENARIKAFVVDTRSALNEYKTRIGNPDDRQKCLDKIYAIPYHHCGDHSRCKFTDICRFVEIQNAHPDWTVPQVQEEYANRSLRFGGRYMDLSEYGMQVLTKEIRRRFNEKNIDRIAPMACSNSCEGYFGELVKFSEGKRLNLEHTDLWYSMLLLVFCGVGNLEETHRQLSALLGLSSTTAEERQLARKKKKREKNRKRAQSEEGKERRHEAKMTTAIRMGKEDSKTAHRSEKLSTTKSSKSKVPRCKKCDGAGHSAKECPVVKSKRKKSDKQLVDWNVLQPRPKKSKYVAKIKW